MNKEETYKILEVSVAVFLFKDDENTLQVLSQVKTI